VAVSVQRGIGHPASATAWNPFSIAISPINTARSFIVESMSHGTYASALLLNNNNVFLQIHGSLGVTGIIAFEVVSYL